MQLLTRHFFMKNILQCRQLASPATPFFILISFTILHGYENSFITQVSAASDSILNSKLTKAFLTEWDHNYLFPSASKTPEWQESSVRLLTGERYRRDLSEADYHVLHIGIPSRKHSPDIIVHLTKRSTLLSPSFKIVVRDGDKGIEEIRGDNANSDCHFYGTVTSSQSYSTRRRKYRNRNEEGNAALSACGNSGGFRGVIMLEDGQWIIEPHPVVNNSKSRKDPLPHIILPPDSSLQSTNFISDELRVPKAELEAAAALAAAEARQRQRLREKAEEEEERLSPTLLSPLYPHQEFGPDYGGQGQPIALAFGSEDIGIGRVIESRKRIRNSDSLLETPDYSEKKTIEIAVFTDEELYNKIKKKYPGDTTSKLKDYVTTMINTMDLLYRQPSLGVEIEFLLVQLEILKKRPGKLNNNGGKAKAYLSSFCDYAGDKNVNSGQWDHALLLTGLDLHEEGAKNTAGLAWAGTMCYRYYSCSISEGTSFGATYIITHEIGHSLGMEHDGVGVSDKCDRDKFIMSPTTGPGKTAWSNCSSGNLKDFLQYGTSELRGRKAGNRPTCLSEIVSRSKKSIDFSTGTLLPGEKYDSGQQCLLAVGHSFRPYFQRNLPPFNDICWMLHCGNGTHAISTHPALEGTKCDRDRYCRKGKCVKRKRK